MKLYVFRQHYRNVKHKQLHPGFELEPLIFHKDNHWDKPLSQPNSVWYNVNFSYLLQWINQETYPDLVFLFFFFKLNISTPCENYLRYIEVMEY